MAKPKGVRVKRTVPTPSSLEEAANYVKAIGQLKRDIDALQASLNEQVEHLTARTAESARPLAERMNQLLEGLYLYAEANRPALTDNGKKKTVDVSSGQFGWRVTPPKVSIANTKQVLANLERLGLEQFIRYTPEVDREAMLRNPALAQTIDGVSITQQELFFVKPLELNVEIPGASKKLVVQKEPA